MKKTTIISGIGILAALIILIIGIYTFNYIRLQSVLNQVINSDGRNYGIEAAAYYDNYIDTSTIAFELKSLPDDKNFGDAYRVILQFIDRVNPQNIEQMDIILNSKKTENVVLAQYKLQSKMEEVLLSGPRNEGIEILVYYSELTNPEELVYDLRDLTGDKSQLDIFRVLLHYAKALKQQEFDYVHLYFQGKEEFKLRGDYFLKIGKEFDFQNPVYTIRTFSENVLNPDGSHAYPQWTGGVIGVLNKQMEDFNDFNKKWYLDSWINRQNNINPDN